MNFEEIFKSWTLEQKVEWALGPNICNLSENMRSIIVDLKAENERLKAELEKRQQELMGECELRITIEEIRDGIEKENATLRKENAKLHCLALHAISEVVRLTAMVSRMFTKTKGIYGHWYNPLLLTEGAIQSAYDRAHRLHNAYCKAKQALREKK